MLHVYNLHFYTKCCIYISITFLHYLSLRDDITRGLNMLRREIPGGDTYMNLGLAKVYVFLIIFKNLKSSDLPMFKVKVTSRQPCSSFLCIRSSMLFCGTCVLTSPVKFRPLPNPPPPFISLTLHDPFLKPVITIIDLYTCFPIAGK